MKTTRLFLLLTFLSVPFLYSAAHCELVINGNRIMDQPMEENLCAITFDDGPSPYTPQLLEILKENGIKATFFVLGSQAVHNPGLIQKILEEGHEIGNHSWAHPNFRHLSLEQQRLEIENTDILLRSFGVVPLYLRPPYGAFDEKTLQIANDLGLSLMLWSLDSHDWKRLAGDYAKLTSTRGTIYDAGSLRGVFLFHDIHKTTVDNAQRIINNLRAGGCEKFVTVNEYMQGKKEAEAPLAMNRKDELPRVLPRPMIAANKSMRPLARCSVPYRGGGQKSQAAMLSAHVQVSEAPSNPKAF